MLIVILQLIEVHFTASHNGEISCMIMV